MKNKYGVIYHDYYYDDNDDFGSVSLMGVFDTYDDAINFILNKYYEGDLEQMGFEKEEDMDICPTMASELRLLVSI